MQVVHQAQPGVATRRCFFSVRRRLVSVSLCLRGHGGGGGGDDDVWDNFCFSLVVICSYLCYCGGRRGGEPRAVSAACAPICQEGGVE